MVVDVLYYPKTKTAINAIRILERKNYYILTIYYTSNKFFPTNAILKDLNLTYKDVIIDRKSDLHENYLHKKDRPFDWHVHIKLSKKYIKSFLEKLIEKIKFEPLHIKRLLGPLSDNKFKEGSIMSLNSFYSNDQIRKTKEYNYLVKSIVADQNDIKLFFQKRGNWKEFEYGNDDIQYLIIYDRKFQKIKENPNYFYLFKSMIRNIITDRKYLIRNDKAPVLEKDELIISFHYIYEAISKGYLHNMLKIKNQKKFINDDKILNKLKELLKELTAQTHKCYDENDFCFIILQLEVSVDKNNNISILKITDNVDYFRDKKVYFDILEGIMYHIVDPHFPPKKNIKEYNNFIKIANK